MLTLFAQQLFRPDSLLNQPMVGLPFVDSLVRGLLLAADNPYRSAVTGETHGQPSRCPRRCRNHRRGSRFALDRLLARCALSCQRPFATARLPASLGASPMAYVREVRLRRAHQSLLESDPSTTSVASVAYRWGFSNLGRFAAAHTARYDEPPAVTLRRRAFRRSQANSGVPSEVFDQVHDNGCRSDQPFALVGELGVNDSPRRLSRPTTGRWRQTRCQSRMQVVRCHRQRWAPVAGHEGATVRRGLIEHLGDASAAEAYKGERLRAGPIGDLQKPICPGPLHNSGVQRRKIRR